jgi:hypothetical protein
MLFFSDKPWLRPGLNFFKKGTSLAVGGEGGRSQIFLELGKEEPKKRGVAV